MRDERPFLFRDVDGVISPDGGSPPPGFKRDAVGGFEVTWNPSHRSAFASLARLFDIVWATTWEHKANKAVSPRLGLPALPVVEWAPQRRGDTWKLADVRRYAGGRPAAWIDDELFNDAFQWAETRDVPTLLIRTMSSVGIKDEHFAELEGFGRAMGAEE